jgi:hypothetical protein
VELGTANFNLWFHLFATRCVTFLSAAFVPASFAARTLRNCNFAITLKLTEVANVALKGGAV